MLKSPGTMEYFQKVMHRKNELSVLGKKIGIQETDLRRGHKQNDQRRELRKCEEALHTQKDKPKESKRCRAIGDQLRKRLQMIQQKPRTSLIGKPSREVPLSKIESVQKELLTQTEELRKTQKRCEELKQSLTQVAVQFQQCRATVRDQREKLKAVTAERNMYRSVTEKLGIELADIKKEQRIEKLRKRAAKRTEDQSSQSHLPPVSPRLQLKTGDKLKSTQLPPTPSKVQEQFQLRIIGTKL